MSHADPVTDEIADYVMARDKGCVAALVYGATGCTDMWGQRISPLLEEVPKRRWRQSFHLDHVHPWYGKMGVRASSTRLWLLCAGHHFGWATKKENRVKAREYLASVGVMP